MDNQLYYGDNLDVMRRHIKDESVDLVYLDPPFNSNANYNVLFAEKDGSKAAGQIQAFTDTWSWGHDDEEIYAELVMTGGKLADCLKAFRTFLGPCDMLAYLVMMAPRLVELRRVMKTTASIYLHCDPSSSHYLKLLLDAIFGAQFFRNEIIWKRTSGHSDAVGYGAVHDTIFFFTKGAATTWNDTFQPYEQEYVDQYYRYTDDKGRRFMSGDIGASGLQGGGYDYEWKGVHRIWRVPETTMRQLDKDGHIFYTRNGIPRRKRYLDESKGMPAQDIWSDIQPLRSWHQERLGYPTQKPVSLLERMIQASSNPGDVVLDPFCGCGTTIDAAQKLGRTWIGIDITHLAITLIKQRLADSFGITPAIMQQKQSIKMADGGVPDKPSKPSFRVLGEPTSVPDAEALAASDPYQFQWWALGLVGARPIDQKKGADHGIDGKIVFQSGGTGEFNSVIISVKAGKTGASHIRDLKGVLEREKAAIGVLISMQDPTQPMYTEAVTAGFYESQVWGRNYPKIQLLTVEEILNGKAIDMPPIRQVSATFKKAPKSIVKQGSQMELSV